MDERKYRKHREDWREVSVSKGRVGMYIITRNITQYVSQDSQCTRVGSASVYVGSRLVWWSPVLGGWRTIRRLLVRPKAPDETCSTQRSHDIQDIYVRNLGRNSSGRWQSLSRQWRLSWLKLSVTCVTSYAAGAVLDPVKAKIKCSQQCI